MSLYQTTRSLEMHKQSGADLAFFQGGGGLTHFFLPILRAAKRRADFFWLFYEPRSGEPIFLAILRAAKRRADFFWAILRAAKRRADFFGYFTSREAASRFFLAILNPRK